VRAPGGGKGRELQGPSGAAAVFSPIPAGTGQRYSKRSPLTVLLRQQVEIIRATVKQGTSFDFVWAGEKP
jgi:hypothetical protein